MILVTGGTGLVGSHLLLELVKAGEEPRAIYRTEESLEAVKKVFSYTNCEEETAKLFGQIEWQKADITDIPSLSQAFNGVKEVYHCAALISFDPSKDSRLRKTNIEGTANVVNFCIKEKVRKLVFLSSIATLDKKPGENVISEASQWNKENDHNIYAITKYGAETEVWRASQEGVPVVILNPGIIIGPGFWDSGSGHIFKRVNNGLNYYFPKVTGFVGVEDLVSIMLLSMRSPVENEAYVVVSENLSFKVVLEEVAKSLNKPAPKKVLKPWMIYLGWIFEKFTAPFSGKDRKLNRHSAKTAFKDSYYSSEKLKSTFNFKFTPVEDSIEATGRSFRKEFSE
ncbi:Nucleoside-diphosphate-sugar epimerase [Salinimicrobium catena]|uniref:Nucleoside-diphosphate-sugar epimerase n=1 Tax=Salinimicrobium catena TaxID=390640 RepID=A0A1H5JKY4_9FLAO|nr:NAD-dependent epimerase/dehydratase family protein [Salinimicrobium catena]SDK88546.1 Nucleoside-diphosphate-sugar epimerase [Salinimicrobium catena]SEE53149.1 Nucleoside-diphosphate-sugar epimerase [Salinimicrobium catena]